MGVGHCITNRRAWAKNKKKDTIHRSLMIQEKVVTLTASSSAGGGTTTEMKAMVDVDEETTGSREQGRNNCEETASLEVRKSRTITMQEREATSALGGRNQSSALPTTRRAAQ